MDVKPTHHQSKNDRIHELELMLALEKEKHEKKPSNSAEKASKGSKAPALLVIAGILIVVLVLVIVANVKGNGSSSPAQSPNPTQSDSKNLALQNDCIAEAQSEVNNDPLNQPIGGDQEAVSLAQQRKALAMQPKIADCKAKYPTN